MEFALFGRLLAACLVITAVLYALHLLTRATARTRIISHAGGRLVVVLETTILPNAAALHVVRVADRYYLLGRNAAQITTVCEIAAESVRAALVAAPARDPKMHPRAMLARLRRRVVGAEAG